MSEYLSRDAIRAVPDRRYKDVEVPSWGGKVRIQNLKVEEYMETILMSNEANGETNRVMLQLATVALGVCEPNLGPADVPWLKEKDAGSVNVLFTEIYQLTGLLDRKEAKDLVEGNPKSSSTEQPQNG